ncbi:MAG TPA: PDZ domain-containing protein [Pyrinomonadaceae bacterium]
MAAHAQQPPPKPAPAPQAPAPPRVATAPAAPARPASPPQIVTVLHRLTGIKLMRWLNRSGVPVAAVVEFERGSATDANMHMSITAGFALNDGQSIIASLPQAEAEVEVGMMTSATEEQRRAGAAPAPSPGAADMSVVRPDGFQLTANYVGLDVLTGLSLLRIEGLKLPSMPDALEEKLAVGQRVRLYAPEPAGRTDARPSNNLYLRLGQIEGRLAAITRWPSGRIAHLAVRAQGLSPSINGGVAVNDAGETVGIVESSTATEARILPVQIVKRAAERVLARRASVPRPLLGVSGRPVTSASVFQFTSSGWSQAEAVALMNKGQGLLLTSVVPNTPAALADLRPGDIIVSVNNNSIKSAEDFSFTLNEAGGDSTVMFTVLRGQGAAPSPAASAPRAASSPQPAPPAAASIPAMPAFNPEAFDLPRPLKPIVVSVKLSYSFQMLMSPKPAGTVTAATAPRPGPLRARGVETLPLASAGAQPRGARAGVLVVSVAAASEAARAGLLEGDVIESVNGKLLSSTSGTETLFARDARLMLGIVRRGQKITVTLSAKKASQR